MGPDPPDRLAARDAKRRKPCDSPDGPSTREENIQPQPPLPTWFSAATSFLQATIGELDSYTKDEALRLFKHALEAARLNEKNDYTHIHTLENTKKEIIHAVTQNNLSYAQAAFSTHKNPTFTHTPTTPPQVHEFTIDLGEKERVTHEIFRATEHKIRQTLEVRKNKLRLSIHQSKKGNAVLRFASQPEKMTAKTILSKEDQYKKKIRDFDDRTVGLWVMGCFQSQDPEHQLTDLKTQLQLFNPQLHDTDFDLDWVGKAKPKLRLRLSMKKAHQILTEKHIYTEHNRHDIIIFRPFPSRCNKCHRIGCHDTRCTNQVACLFCSRQHHQDDCPSKENIKKHRCAACINYVFIDGPPDIDTHHAANDRDCPAFYQEAQKMLRELESKVAQAGQGLQLAREFPSLP